MEKRDIMVMDINDLAPFMDFLTKKAEEKRANAGFAGTWGDGGAGKIEDEMEVYKAGRYGGIPETWKTSWQEYVDSTNPEYEQYLKLKQKFE